LNNAAALAYQEKKCHRVFFVKMPLQLGDNDDFFAIIDVGVG